jgi:hypothetical protein
MRKCASSTDAEECEFNGRERVRVRVQKKDRIFDADACRLLKRAQSKTSGRVQPHRFRTTFAHRQNGTEQNRKRTEQTGRPADPPVL